MTIDLATVIDAPADRVWDEVQTPRLLAHVASPLVRFAPVEPPAWPVRYADGRYLVALRLFGWLAIGRQWIVTSRPAPRDGAERLLRDDGYGTLVRRWDHLIRIAPRADGRTDYRDTVTIEAGPLTPAFAAFAWLFYRHRQRRWRRLARRGFRYT